MSLRLKVFHLCLHKQAQKKGKRKVQGVKPEYCVYDSRFKVEKNIKEVPLQHRKTKIAAKFDLHEKQDVARDKSVLPEKGNIEQ